MEVIAFSALVDDRGGLQPAARARLVESDVIVGVDSASKCEFTVFGTPAFEDSFDIKRPLAMRTLRVEIDHGAGQLEALMALVKTAKGAR